MWKGSIKRWFWRISNKLSHKMLQECFLVKDFTVQCTMHIQGNQTEIIYIYIYIYIFSMKPKVTMVMVASEITENVYCNCVHIYWEGCVICSIYLR